MVHIIPTVSNIMLHINLTSTLNKRQRLSESVKCVCVCFPKILVAYFDKRTVCSYIALWSLQRSHTGPSAFAAAVWTS